MDRMAMLKELVTANPSDTFARYGLAMEYANSGDLGSALAEFAVLLKNSPDYTPGYFMAAQTLVKANGIDEAKKMLREGIASASRTNNPHARGEMEELLAELTSQSEPERSGN